MRRTLSYGTIMAVNERRSLERMREAYERAIDKGRNLYRAFNTSLWTDCTRSELRECFSLDRRKIKGYLSWNHLKKFIPQADHVAIPSDPQFPPEQNLRKRSAQPGRLARLYLRPPNPLPHHDGMVCYVSAG